MLFNSYVFVLFFLPVCLTGYFGLNHFRKYRLAELFLLGMSLWFYAYFNLKYLFIILSSVCVNYGVYRLFQRLSSASARKAVLLAGLALNLGVLFYYKYTDFFLLNINRVFHTQLPLLGILLPLGISFFTFQQLSFLVDAYRGEVGACDFLSYACFVTYFPQLIAGPIVTHDELIPQLRDESKKHLNWDNLAPGIYLFALGMAKKVLLADTFGNAVNWGYANVDSLDATNAILTMLGYTLQIYFDFSGYCDMAIGIGRMMNIDLPVNFNSPYKALTITEFWDRWHMTLTRFFTRYVYIPLGGSRRGEARTYRNILIVFLLSGFWHGAGWTFVFWGLCHGLFSVVTRRFRGFFDRLHPALNWILTFSFVNVMWVFFRADSFAAALRLLNRIARMNFGPIQSEILNCFKLVEINYFVTKTPIQSVYPYFQLAAFFIIAFFMILGARNAYEKAETFRPSFGKALTAAVLLVWCVFSFSGISTFLYFNF